MPPWLPSASRASPNHLSEFRHRRKRQTSGRSDQRGARPARRAPVGRRLRRGLRRRALGGDARAGDGGWGTGRAGRGGLPIAALLRALECGVLDRWERIIIPVIRTLFKAPRFALGSGAGRDRCQPQHCRSSLVGEPLRQTPNTGYRAPGWWEHRPRPKLTPLLSSRIARARRTPGPRSGAGRYPAPLHPPDQLWGRVASPQLPAGVMAGAEGARKRPAD